MARPYYRNGGANCSWIIHVERGNEAVRGALTGHATDTYSDSIAKVDLINESLAFTIDNIQVLYSTLTLLHH